MNFLYNTHLLLIVSLALLCPTVSSVPQQRKYSSSVLRWFGKKEPPIEKDKKSTDGIDLKNQSNETGTEVGQSEGEETQNENEGGQNGRITTKKWSPQMRETTNAGPSRSTSFGNISPLSEMPQSSPISRRGSSRPQRTRSSKNQHLAYQSPKKKIREEQNGYDTESENDNNGTRGRSGGGRHNIESDNDNNGTRASASRPEAAAQNGANGQQGTNGRSESAGELITKFVKSGAETIFYSTKLAGKAAGTTKKWLNNHVEKPDMELMAECAKHVASAVGDVVSVGKTFTCCTANIIWPPAKRFVFPTLGVLCRHIYPITKEFCKSCYAGAIWLKPRVGRVLKPAWRKGRKIMRKKMRPAYNRMILPTIKAVAEKVEKLPEWPESNSESENNGKASGSAEAGRHSGETSSRVYGKESRKAPTKKADSWESESDSGKSGKNGGISEALFDQLQSEEEEEDKDWRE